jgi:large subunit ribosomal protein L22
MDVSATTKFVRISPTKARDIAARLTGLSAEDALKVTGLSPRKAARAIGKTLKSAIANAESNASLAVNSLSVKKACVDEGPRLRRYWPRARGSASPITKRTSHIMIVLTDGVDASTE